METIEHEGFVYQIGAIYEFSDEGKNWYASTLNGVIGRKNRCFDSDNGLFDHIRECKTLIGVIAKPPVILTAGECYLIDVEGEKELTAVYMGRAREAFAYKNGIVCEKNVSNIKPLRSE